jgi:hypothetical protein
LRPSLVCIAARGVTPAPSVRALALDPRVNESPRATLCERLPDHRPDLRGEPFLIESNQSGKDGWVVRNGPLKPALIEEFPIAGTLIESH